MHRLTSSSPVRKRARPTISLCACLLSILVALPHAQAQETDGTDAMAPVATATDADSDATSDALVEASVAAEAAVPSAQSLDVKASTAVESPDKKIERATLGVWPYNPLRNLKEGALGLFDRQNQVTLAVGVVAVLGARTQDEKMQEYFNKKERLGNLDNLGNHYLGTGVPGTILGASFWLLGDLAGRPYLAHAGQAQVEALLATGILTAALKGAFNRERPDRSDKYSMPSGHTSTVFTSAMVLHEFYGWKVGVPGFLLGALTAASRMSDNRHWFSDTIAGATLGILVGHSFARAHLNRYNGYVEEKKLAIFPVIEEGGGRLVFRLGF